MSEKSLIEAALFVAGDGVSVKELEKITGLDSKSVKSFIDQLKEEYIQRDSALLITVSDDGYVMRVKPEFEEHVMPLIPETDLSKAMLKTLAFIAHEQPIKQSKLVKIRGNRVYRYIHHLIDLEFIEAKPEGRTKILSTTDKFKEYFKISDIGEVMPEAAPEDPAQTTLESPEEPVEDEVKTESESTEIEKPEDNIPKPTEIEEIEDNNTQ